VLTVKGLAKGDPSLALEVVERQSNQSWRPWASPAARGLAYQQTAGGIAGTDLGSFVKQRSGVEDLEHFGVRVAQHELPGGA
jgi:hypothetical protein